MTADCPVCGRLLPLDYRRTQFGSVAMMILPHFTPERPGEDCWGGLRAFSLEDVRAAVEIRKELGERLRLAAHP